MHELRRMAYLDALGVDSYVSRAQLPGAAATRRLAIVTASKTQQLAAATCTRAAGTLPRISRARARRSICTCGRGDIVHV